MSKILLYVILFLRTIQWTIFSTINFGIFLISFFFVNWWVIFFNTKITSKDYLGNSHNLGAARLWKCFAWFGTFDASLDAYWLDQYVANTYTIASPPSFWLRKKWQLFWLARNTAYGWAYYPLGCKMNVANWTVVKWINSSTLILWIAYSKSGLWDISIGSAKYGTWKLGWKAWNYWNPTTSTFQTYSWGPSMRTQIVASINPFSD